MKTIIKGKNIKNTYQYDFDGLKYHYKEEVLMDFIYKFGLAVNTFGGKPHYSFTLLKCQVKSQTKDNVLLHDGKRIKKINLDKIIEGLLNNGTKHIGYIIWTFDLSKQESYKQQLKERIIPQIDKYRKELLELEQIMLTEPEFCELERD